MSEYECCASERRPPRERLVRKAAIMMAITGLYVIGVGTVSTHDNITGPDHTGGWSAHGPVDMFSGHWQRYRSVADLVADLDRKSNTTDSDSDSSAYVHESLARANLGRTP
jgi:hypothetical protein